MRVMRLSRGSVGRDIRGFVSLVRPSRTAKLSVKLHFWVVSAVPTRVRAGSRVWATFGDATHMSAPASEHTDGVERQERNYK